MLQVMLDFYEIKLYLHSNYVYVYIVRVKCYYIGLCYVYVVRVIICNRVMYM